MVLKKSFKKVKKKKKRSTEFGGVLRGGCGFRPGLILRKMGPEKN